MDDDPIPTVTQAEIEGDRMDEYDPHIFKRREILRPTFVPDMARIVGREEEISQIEDVMEPACHGDPPRDAAIISKPGTGKTLCVKSVSGRVRAIGEKNGNKVITSYMNCGEENTKTQVVQQLARSANAQVGYPVDIPKSGISTSEYYKRLWEILSIPSAFIFILDEVDKLGDDANDVVKSIADAESDGKTCYTGAILISNKTNTYDNLDPRVQSRFENNDEELVFAPYNATQLRAILRNREDAFHDGVLTDDVIPLCAAFAAQEHGDARKALDLLLAAGNYAQKQGDAQVTEMHVRKVHNRAAASRDIELIVTSLTHAQYVLYALARLTKENKQHRFSTGVISEQYMKVCEEVGVDAQSHNSILNHLKKWAEIEHTEHEHTGGGRDKGSYREHQLLVDPDIVIETVERRTMEE